MEQEAALAGALADVLWQAHGAGKQRAAVALPTLELGCVLAPHLLGYEQLMRGLTVLHADSKEALEVCHWSSGHLGTLVGCWGWLALVAWVGLAKIM